jgi:hypothetical protein
MSAFKRQRQRSPAVDLQASAHRAVLARQPRDGEAGTAGVDDRHRVQKHPFAGRVAVKAHGKVDVDAESFDKSTDALTPLPEYATSTARAKGDVSSPATLPRVSHVCRDPELGQQVGKPAPAKRCLESDLDRLWPKLINQLLHLRWPGSKLAVEHQLAVLVDRYHLALLAMTVHSDVNHAQGLLPVGCMIAGESGLGR